MEATAPKTAAIWYEAANSFNAIDYENDSNTFIKCLKTGEEKLRDFHFSDTQEVLKKKMAIRTVSSMEMKPETDTDEQIIAMSGKVGRKKAMEKVKSLDKEIVEVEKQRQGIESLIGAYRDMPNGKDAHQDLLVQRGDTELKLNTLLMKKHRLNCYIAQVDNKTIPEPPALFGQGLSDSPTSYASGSRPEAQENTGVTGSSKATIDFNLPHSRLSSNIGGFSSLNSDSKIEKFIVMYDFEAASESQELTMKIGEILEVVLNQEDG
jgi:hypothetical protein